MTFSPGRRRTRVLVVAAGMAALELLGACRRRSGANAEYTGPISGELVLAEGASAPLGTNGIDGSGFTLDATLGNADLTAPAGATWQCFAPQPPLYPDYNILAQDGSTWLFALVVTSSHWHSGTVLVDNSNVLLQISLPDRFGIGTNGTLTLTTGSSCGFKVEGVTLNGEQESPTGGGGGGGGF